MQMPKPTEADRAYFHALVPAGSGVDVRPMFGNLGAYVNGNMFMGLFGSDVGLKLPDAEGARLRDAGGGPFGPAERPMGGYVALPTAWHGHPERGAEWAAAALEHVAALPPKQPKQPKKAAGNKATR
jgi:TfoX/Sxy family transcriptional regulator of competence genes